MTKEEIKNELAKLAERNHAKVEATITKIQSYINIYHRQSITDDEFLDLIQQFVNDMKLENSRELHQLLSKKLN